MANNAYKPIRKPMHPIERPKIVSTFGNWTVLIFVANVPNPMHYAEI
jgi:hypothetical protein